MAANRSSGSSGPSGPSGPSGLTGIGQIALVVSDVDRATAWYRDVLGLRFLFSAPPGLAFFDCGGVRLMLASGESAAPGSSSVVYYKVEDINATHADLSARGADFEDSPHLITRMGDVELWMTFLRDPDANLLALMCEVKV
ncbi:MAG: VOC family protein [Gemmatimonadota bacterium]|nr:VOC family protein [Gemmatimonadota bacterium]